MCSLVTILVKWKRKRKGYLLKPVAHKCSRHICNSWSNFQGYNPENSRWGWTSYKNSSSELSMGTCHFILSCITFCVFFVRWSMAAWVYIYSGSKCWFAILHYCVIAGWGPSSLPHNICLMLSGVEVPGWPIIPLKYSVRSCTFPSWLEMSTPSAYTTRMQLWRIRMVLGHDDRPCWHHSPLLHGSCSVASSRLLFPSVLV